MSLLSDIQTQPSVQYRKNPWFYFQYDGLWLAAIVTSVAAMWFTGWQGLFPGWSNWYLLALPVTIYLHILANVCIHNACHVNFPRRINRVVGEILGVLVMTRFASWEILHVRHHKYSDDVDKDPHPIIPNFWLFLIRIMFVNLERQLQNIRYDQYGDTPTQHRVELGRAILSFGTMMILFVAWMLFLGPWVFFFIFMPTQAVGWIHVTHFNWVTHNAHDPGGDYKPINIDTGVYWLGNRLLFGLYMHGNHHKRANLFNPLKMEQVLAAKKAAKAAEAPAAEPAQPAA